MIDAELESMVAAEIVALHQAFEDWFRGELDDLRRVELALSDDFTFISPRGDIVARNNLIRGLTESRGSRAIRIRIAEPVVKWRAAHAVLATYEEWHDHASYTTIRVSTVLLSRSGTAHGGILWRHVHETWRTPPP